jgi:hypothetical protein
LRVAGLRAGEVLDRPGRPAADEVEAVQVLADALRGDADAQGPLDQPGQLGRGPRRAVDAELPRGQLRPVPQEVLDGRGDLGRPARTGLLAQAGTALLEAAQPAADGVVTVAGNAGDLLGRVAAGGEEDHLGTQPGAWAAAVSQELLQARALTAAQVDMEWRTHDKSLRAGTRRDNVMLAEAAMAKPQNLLGFI